MFERIEKEDVCDRIEKIMFSHCAFLQSSPKHSGPWLLVRLPDLPKGMHQIASKHSIVLKTDNKRILKFTPRVPEKFRLLSLLVDVVGPVDGVNRVAVVPTARFKIKALTFFGFPAVEPPLSRDQIFLCFSDFVLKSAIALRILHTKDKIAHQDIRTFNIGYIRVDGQARVVFIDLDGSTSELAGIVTSVTGNNCPQFQKPAYWPSDVKFDAQRSDWRQWALMVWSLLRRELEAKIYGGELAMSGMAFLDTILHGTGQMLDSLTEENLVAEVQTWLKSVDVQAVKKAMPHMDTSTLTEQVPLLTRLVPLLPSSVRCKIVSQGHLLYGGRYSQKVLLPPLRQRRSCAQPSTPPLQVCSEVMKGSLKSLLPLQEVIPT